MYLQPQSRKSVYATTSLFLMPEKVLLIMHILPACQLRKLVKTVFGYSFTQVCKLSAQIINLADSTGPELYIFGR